jgi:carboxylesterase type B
VTFGSSASGLCGKCALYCLQKLSLLIATDPTNLVRRSIEIGQPMIVVTLNYRLNMFAFGDGSGEKNLALSDQRSALQFVRQHIGGFGGDPVTRTLTSITCCWLMNIEQENLTLAGESAGAVYVHAHMVMGVPIRQAILQSGSLYLSPPIPEARAGGIVARVEERLSLKGCAGLRDAKVEEFLEAQADLGMISLFLQTEPGLEDWREKLGHAERLLLGDCEYEVSDSI